MPADVRSAIRERARQLGFDDCRFTTAASPGHAADFERWLGAGRHGEMNYLQRNGYKRVNPALVLPGAKTIVTLIVNYNTNAPDAASGASAARGQIARYARYADYHNVLAEPLKNLARFIDESGRDGARSLWYVDTGPLLERDLGERSGIGFIGKHTNLISRKLGNWIFLAEIITTLELEPDAPEKNHCGHCRRCIDACPTAAITAPFQLDARRCISYLTIELKGSIPEEFRPAIGHRIYGCDDCLAACPWNRFARDASLMRPHYRDELAAPDLIELLSLDEAAFKKRFAGTPILRAKRRGLLRNVCVALGNAKSAGALPALARAARDSEPIIAEHAQWAIRVIGEKAQGPEISTT